MRGAGTPLWEDLADPDLRRALEPGVPEGLDRTPDVLVVGGGVAGLAVAVMCRRAGIPRVVVLERNRLAAGPSGRAAGALIPGVHALTQPPAFASLAARGMTLHEQLHGHEVTAADWRVGDAVVGGQGGLDPLRLAALLAAGAGAVATGVEVAPLDEGRTVKTSVGSFTPGAVVWATGSPPQGWVRGGFVKGHLVATEPVPLRLDAAISDEVVVLQRPDGRLVAGGTLEAAATDPAVDFGVIALIEASLVRLVPAAAGARITHRWTCFRPTVADELPVVDRLPHRADAWAIAGLHRSGLLTAPAIGEAVAAWITTGRRPAAAARLAADRPALQQLVEQQEHRGGG